MTDSSFERQTLSNPCEVAPARDGTRTADAEGTLSATVEQPEAAKPPFSEKSALPADLQPLGLFSRTGFLLTSMVAGLSSVCIKQLLLPLQIATLDPQTTNTSFALVSAIGAVAGLLAAPLTGALADRTTSRWGRRRPWLVAGIVVGVLGLLTMAAATTIPVLVLGEILEQLGVDAVLANVTALIPELIPERQRASTSALNGMAPIVGGVLGLVIVTFLTNPRVVLQGYLVLAVLSLGFVVFFVLVLHERPLRQEDIAPFRVRAFLVSFLRPLTARDFVLTLLSRLLVFVTFTLLGSYLFFYLRKELHLSVEEAARGVTSFQVLSASVLLITALLTGHLSRVLGRVKPFAVMGAVLMALALFILVFNQTQGILLPVAALFGCGWGSYLGVDTQLAVRVLPRETERGKDLGILYTAIFLPLIVTPLLGATILNHAAHGFALLFTVAAVASLLAALFIVPIRSVT
ncbi:MAG TPA: MFS transporter [Ktedonobacteraceae bacterium]|nr:MFS transporter [Ktedonobacteraceae bacterium]